MGQLQLKCFSILFGTHSGLIKNGLILIQSCHDIFTLLELSLEIRGDKYKNITKIVLLKISRVLKWDRNLSCVNSNNLNWVINDICFLGKLSFSKKTVFIISLQAHVVASLFIKNFKIYFHASCFHPPRQPITSGMILALWYFCLSQTLHTTCLHFWSFLLCFLSTVIYFNYTMSMMNDSCVLLVLPNWCPKYHRTFLCLSSTISIFSPFPLLCVAPAGRRFIFLSISARVYQSISMLSVSEFQSFLLLLQNLHLLVSIFSPLFYPRSCLQHFLSHCATFWIVSIAH